MGVVRKEIWVIDNNGYTDGPFDTISEAKKRIKENIKNRDFQYTGNCAIVKILGTFDDYCIGHERYIDSRGFPISNT